MSTCRPSAIAALEGEQVAHDAQHVHVVGVPLQDAAEEIEFKIELVLVRPVSSGVPAKRVRPSLDCLPCCAMSVPCGEVP